MRKLLWLLLVVGCDDADGDASADVGAAGEGGAGGGGAAGEGGAGGGGGAAGEGGAGGGGGAAGEGGGGDQPFSLRFAGQVGAEPFRCAASPTGLGADGAQIEPLDFRLYVHDVRFLTAAGDAVPATLTQDGLWQLDGLALLDFEDKTGTCENGTAETRTVIEGVVPAGTYTGVAFTLGVPFELNHADVAVAPSPLNLSGLFWNWNGGYKFVRADARVMGGAQPSVFNIHLGSTGCEEDAMGVVTTCARPNRADVVLADFDAATQTIVVDYAALVAGSTLGVNGGGAPGCMSGPDDPECPAIFERLGLDLATGAPAEGQAFFRVQ